MFFISNPGPWQSFVRRSDNVGLPLMEVKQKYLKEQALFEADQRRQYNEYLKMIHHSQGGSGGGVGFSGQGIDGPIAGATVLAVAEGKTTTTDANGFFTFNFVPAGDIELTGGTDTVTGVAFTGTLKAPQGSTIISPITTAIKEIMNQGKSEDEATTDFFEFAKKVYDIDVPAGKRERVKSENFINLATTDSDFLKVVGLATTLESAAEVAGEAATRAAVGKTLNNAKESFYAQIGQICRDNNFKTNTVDDNAKNDFKTTLMRVDSNVSAANARAIREALDNQLTRVQEIVNDVNMDKEFGITSVMAQNRIAKKEITNNVKMLYDGTIDIASVKARSESAVNSENNQIQQLGTIFEGKPNKEEPSEESQANLYPTAVDYVTESDGNKYAQGELTRSLSTKINGLPTYSGIINSEATFLWYDRSIRSWVLDNNLEAPYIAANTIGRTFPIYGNYVDKRAGVTVIIAKPDEYPDAPSVGQGGRRTIDSLNARNGLGWSIADNGETNRETGVTTWQVRGKITPGTIDGRASLAFFDGDFTITQNEGSQLYVITLGRRGANFVEGLSTTSLSFFNMGVRLSDIRQRINQTRAFTPTFVAASFT
jgi:hypothetical protein